MRTFFRWAVAEGYPVAPRILQMPKVRVPWKEPGYPLLSDCLRRHI
jgi:hypothetical protein